MAWHEIEARAAEESTSARIVAMETIQVFLLEAMFSSPLSTRLAFQGGTCLRLVHGGYRYSEDLDLVTSELSDNDLDRLMADAARGAAARLAGVLDAGDARLDAPKLGGGGRLRAWWFRYQRLGAREVLRVKIEVGRYPAHEARVSPLCREILPFTPRPLVLACTPRELLADKVNALAQRPYLKARDLFDLWFLAEILHVPADIRLIHQKFADYGTASPLEALQSRLAALDACDLDDELGRFVPRVTRRMLEEGGYLPVRTAARKVLEAVVG
jgi:predicted nucleotidyltransferase component of viral defense system